jgi:hypothetical protein
LILDIGTYKLLAGEIQVANFKLPEVGSKWSLNQTSIYYEILGYSDDKKVIVLVFEGTHPPRKNRWGIEMFTEKKPWFSKDIRLTPLLEALF